MNRSIGVPALTGSDRLKAGLQTNCAPMHGVKVVRALCKPWLVWSSAFRRLEPLGPAEAGTPSRQRLHGPDACAKSERGLSMNGRILLPPPESFFSLAPRGMSGERGVQ